MKNDEEKKIMKRKRVVRIGLPETNSSSSHSVSINMGDDVIMPGDPRFNLEIKDNKLFVPIRPGGFNWEVEKYNDPLTKLQYVCGMLCGCYTRSGQIRLIKFRRLLCKLFNVSDVVFEWDVQYRRQHEELMRKIKGNEVDCEGNRWSYDDDPSVDYPEIDHNSHDIFDEVIESTETIKKFILNPNSWLYLGNDNSNYPPHFYDDSWLEPEYDEPEYTCHIDFGNNIGRVDFNIPYLLSNNLKYSSGFICSIDEVYDILTTIKYDPKTKISEVNVGSSILALGGDNSGLLGLYDSEIIYMPDGSLNLLFTNKKYNDSYSKFLTKENKETELLDNIGLRGNWFGFFNVANKYGFLEDVDYKLFKIEIESNKYGKIC